jgi:hypothetical protein
MLKMDSSLSAGMGRERENKKEFQRKREIG